MEDGITYTETDKLKSDLRLAHQALVDKERQRQELADKLVSQRDEINDLRQRLRREQDLVISLASSLESFSGRI